MSKNYLKNLPQELHHYLNGMRMIMRRNNLSVYFVGGFVRDLILGEKNLDLDIVVEGDGIKFAKDFASLFMGRVVEHKQFGTASVSLGHHLKVDFSSARREIYPKPAHLPVVSPGALRDDLFRRDFTINAMALSLNTGRLIDYFGGLKDLKAKKIRIMHPLSFIDDPTRILRAIRFEQRFKFRIDPKTFKYLKESVSLGMLEKVHPHRLRDELIIMLKEKAPANNIKRLAQLGGLKFIHPRLRITRSNTALFNSVKNKISWFKSGHFERRPVEYWLVYLMALLDALNLGEAKKICQEFGFRKGEAKRIFDYKEVNRSKVFELNKAKIKPSRIYAILEPLSYESIIMLAAKYSRVYLNEHIADFLEIYNGMRIYVSGEDLHGLGVLPGPGYQKIFSHVLNAKLNGQVRTKEQEMLLIKELIKKRSR